MVPADHLGHALTKKALSLNNVTTQCVASLEALNQMISQLQLKVIVQDRPMTIESYFVFGCDGAFRCREINWLGISNNR